MVLAIMGASSIATDLHQEDGEREMIRHCDVVMVKTPKPYKRQEANDGGQSCIITLQGQTLNQNKENDMHRSHAHAVSSANDLT